MMKTPRVRKTLGIKKKRAHRRVQGLKARVLRAPQPPQTVHLGRFLLAGRAYPCALGRGGITSQKKEGDGGTPRAKMAVLYGAYRADKVKKPAGSESFWKRIKTTDGWCDTAFHPSYNRPVALPFRSSHERMWRDDHLYDRLIVLDWNISSRAHQRGSAIFFHQARMENGVMRPTEGCIALAPATFSRLAANLMRLSFVEVL